MEQEHNEQSNLSNDLRIQDTNEPIKQKISQADKPFQENPEIRRIFTIKEQLKTKKTLRNFSSPKNNQDKTPLSYRLVMQSMLFYWQNTFKGKFKKNDQELRQCNTLESGAIMENFSAFSRGISVSHHIEKLNLSGCDIHPYLLMELSEALSINRSIKELDLSATMLSSFMLSYLFKGLSKNKTLYSLKISNNQSLDNESVQDLIELLLYKNKVKSLNLSHTNIPSMPLAHLCSSLSYADSLISLNLSLMTFTPIALLALAKGLSKNKSLQHLNISYTGLGEDGIRMLVDNLSFFGVPNIKTLNIAGNRIHSHQEIKRLLEKFPNCRELDISYNKLKSIEAILSKSLDKHLQILKAKGNQIEEIPDETLSNLEVLDLSHNRIRFKGANKIAKKLRQIPNPKWIILNLDNNYIESEGFNDIIYALRDNQNLKTFSIAYNQLDGESVICMIVNYDTLQLENLDITGNQIHYSIVFVFLKLMKQCRLHKLSFCDLDNDTKGEGQHECKFALNCEALQELDFSGNEYISCAVVCSLQTRLNNIEILSLKGCTPFHEQDLINLSNFIKKSQSLKDLNLRGLGIGILGVLSVEQFAIVIGQSSKLQRLDLSKNKLSKIGLNIKSVLEGIGRCSNLEFLQLSENGLSSKHRSLLQRMLIKSKSLIELSVSHNSLSIASILTLDLEDQWQLFFRSQYEQFKQRKQQQQSNISNLQAVSENIQVNLKQYQVSSIKTVILQGAVATTTVEDKRREFMRDYRKALKESVTETSEKAILRLRLRNLKASKLKLKSDDLKVIGKLLSEGECIKELDLSNNKELATSNLTSDSIIGDSTAEILKFSHQIFRGSTGIRNMFMPTAGQKKSHLPVSQLIGQSQLQVGYSSGKQSRNQRGLEQLILKRCILDQGGIIGLCSALTTDQIQNSLRVFSASNLIVPVGGMCEILQALRSCLGLEVLKLRSILFEVDLAEQLGTLLAETTELKLLDLSENEITPEQFQFLSLALSKNNTLHNLILEKMRISQQLFVQLFDSLASVQTLKLIDLSHNSLQMQAFQELTKLLQKSQKLKFLNISYHMINANPTKQQVDPKKADNSGKNNNNLNPNYQQNNNGNNHFNDNIHKVNNDISINHKDKSEIHINNKTETVNNTGKNCLFFDDNSKQEVSNINSPDSSNNDFGDDVSHKDLRYSSAKMNQREAKGIDKDFYMSFQKGKSRTENFQQKENIEKVTDNNNNELINEKQHEDKQGNIRKDLEKVKLAVYTDNYINEIIFKPFILKICGKNSLRHLDLSACGLNSQHFGVLVDALCSTESQIKSLNISSNPIQENSDSSQICRLFSSNNALQEINLRFCGITIQGYQALAKGLFQGRGLKCLDVSDNKNGDDFCECLLSEAKHSQTQDQLSKNNNKLQFLFVSQTGIGKRGNEYLKKLLELMQGFLFISNEWVEVDDQLAQLILNSYSSIFKKYNFIPQMVPSYLKKLSITESQISDAFCVSLARKIYEYEFLEEIDLSNNINLTSVGKISLFLHLFDIRYDNGNLRSFQIKNNKSEFSTNNLVDQGVLSAMAHHINAKQTQLRFLQRINARFLCTKYLMPTKYQLNQNLHTLLENKQNPQMIIFLVRFSNLIILIQQSLLPIYLSRSITVRDQDTLQFIFILFVLIAIMISLSELFLICNKKLKKKDIFELFYQVENMIFLSNFRDSKHAQLSQNIFIVSHLNNIFFVGILRFGNKLLFSNEDLYPEYWKRWVSKREAFVGLMGLLEKTDGLLDSTLMALFYEDGYDYLLFLSLLFFILKSLRKLGLSLIYSKMRDSLTGKEEVSQHLQSTWKYALNSGFFITESYINRFSPSDSIHVRISEKINFQMNYKTALNFYQLIFETLPFLFLYLTYLAILKYDKADSGFQIFPIVYGSVKNVILSIFQFMSFLLYKPSQIGQNHFDEAFTSLQYRKALQQIGEAGESVRYSANLLSHQKPAKFTNLRSLLNGNRFRDQVILKDKQFLFSQRTPQYNMFDDADTDKYNSLHGNNSNHRATLSKNRNEEDSFHEKYQEGFAKKNKHCFQADKHRKNTQNNSTNNHDKLQDIGQDHCEDKDLKGGEQHNLNENYEENISIFPHSRKHLHPYSPVERELSLSNIVVGNRVVQGQGQF